MMEMIRGGASCVSVDVRVLVVLSVCRQQGGSLLVHPPGLNSLNQTEEILLTFRNRTDHVVQIRKGAPLVLHPVRLQTDSETGRWGARQIIKEIQARGTS